MDSRDTLLGRQNEPDRDVGRRVFNLLQDIQPDGMQELLDNTSAAFIGWADNPRAISLWYYGFVTTLMADSYPSPDGVHVSCSNYFATRMLDHLGVQPVKGESPKETLRKKILEIAEESAT